MHSLGQCHTTGSDFLDICVPVRVCACVPVRVCACVCLAWPGLAWPGLGTDTDTDTAVWMLVWTQR